MNTHHEPPAPLKPVLRVWTVTHDTPLADWIA
jgi:hypothetical protein